MALLALPLALAVAVFAAPHLAQGPDALPPQVANADTLITATPVVPNVTVSQPSATAAPEPSATPTATSAPTARPTLTPTLVVPPRIGVQVGHWHSDELPDELADLRGNTGAAAAGYTETQVNLEIAQRVAALLTEQGFTVDLLPATIPPGYKADAFVAIHADGSPSSAASGFKIATSWRTSPASQHLLDALVSEYAAATALPQDASITFNMRGYYAFSRRFRHAIDRTTPAVIVEMGFLTNPGDRALMVEQPDRIAGGIAQGVTRYLSERDPNDLAALQPPNFALQRARNADGADVHVAPSADAPVLAHVSPDQLLMPFEHRSGWYHVVVRGGSRIVGWVNAGDLRPTSDPRPTG
jgi:N-acetylmuramoyl-L-alanine amidase